MMGGMSLGMNFWGLTTMFLFWAILVVGAVWLVSLLFPAAQHVDSPKKSNSREQEISSNDKTTF